MGYTKKILDNEVRPKIAPTDEALKMTRERRDDVLDVAESFKGVRDRFNSGSVAHGTANGDLDADCGIVLDRRVHPSLGPDGEGEPPNDVVEKVRAHIRTKLKEKYPDVRCRTTKRAIEVTFNEPLSDGTDPTVDLIVGLERKEKPGLWIPHLDAERWDASHPKEHTRLLTSGPKELRVARARIIRLAKAWNSSFSEGNKALSSFNLEALALECITEDHDLDDGLAELFRYAAAELADHNTEDPAGVSPPIKLLLDRETVVKRLRSARDRMKEALAQDDDEVKVREAMAALFPDYVEPPDGDSKAATAARIAQGKSRFGATLTGAAAGREYKQTSSYGGALR